MPDSERLNGELNDVIGRLVEQREADHEGFIQERETLALLVVGIERHISSLGHLVEQAKTRLAGISPGGRST